MNCPQEKGYEKMKEWKLKSPIIEELERSVKDTMSHVPPVRPPELIFKFLKFAQSINNKQEMLQELNRKSSED